MRHVNVTRNVLMTVVVTMLMMLVVMMMTMVMVIIVISPTVHFEDETQVSDRTRWAHERQMSDLTF